MTFNEAIILIAIWWWSASCLKGAKNQFTCWLLFITPVIFTIAALNN